MSDEVLTVQAMDGQYLLESNELHDDPWPEPWQGLFNGEETWIAVLTGTRYGPVWVRVQLRDTAPDTLDSGWDMVAERDLWCTEGGLRVHDLYSDAPGYHLDISPGPYRVRVHVAQRSVAAAVGDTREPTERHFLQVWPTSDDAEPQLLTDPDSYATAYR